MVFPVSLFLPESDLRPVREGAHKIIGGLTKAQSAKETVATRETIGIDGTDYEDAFAAANLLFQCKMWSDGLPIVPPTRKRVNWVLGGTSRKREDLIGKMLPRGGAATIETLAVNLAMAGGRPEYLPVLIAAVEAILQEKSRHKSWNSTTCGTYPAVVVSGPVAGQIRLNSGYGCLGPHPLKPAGACIGRAIRLLQQNVGGAVPEAGTMSIYGGPARYANVVFAEDQDGLPPGWKALSEERGYAAGSNTVTVLPVSSASNLVGTETGTEEQARAALDRYAGFMGAPNGNYYSLGAYNGSPGILLMARGTAEGLARFGWSKEKIRRYLWETSKIASYKLVGLDWLRPDLSQHKLSKADLDQDPMPVTRYPENIIIVVAGGAQSGHGYWMQVGCCTEGPTSSQIRLPDNWRSLMAEAEKDLGPCIPDSRMIRA